MVTLCNSWYKFFTKSDLKGLANEEVLLSKIIEKESVLNEYDLKVTVDKVFSRNILDKSEHC